MVEIRQATEKDAHYICELNESAFGYHYPEEKTEERLRYILSRKTDRIWVACNDGLIVGYIHAADYECTYSDSLKNIMEKAHQFYSHCGYTNRKDQKNFIKIFTK